MMHSAFDHLYMYTLLGELQINLHFLEVMINIYYNCGQDASCLIDLCEDWNQNCGILGWGKRNSEAIISLIAPDQNMV